ncbi:MAG: alpha/beta hydrolase [Pseudomonadota bacterium]
MTVHSVSVRIGARALTAEIHVPATLTDGLPPLLALHGISRDARGIAREFTGPCAMRGQILIVPRFSNRHWPHFQRIGGVRPDQALLSLLSIVKDMGLAATQRVALFGYSGGAQLAHRFAMIYPQRVASLHVAAAGWYCLPDPSIPFPVGIGPADGKLKVNVPALALTQLADYLRLPLRVYVGSDDTLRDDALRKDARLDDIQGQDRRARAYSFADTFRAAGDAHGIIPDLSITELPRCGHSFSDCAGAGLTARVCDL